MARLNALELRAMSSPLRWALQKHYELPVFVQMLRRAGVYLQGKRLLDAGCGGGRGLLLLHEQFAPSRLVGLDLMPEQVERARALGVPGADVRVGDVTRIDEPDGAFDGVFVFGILHHEPRWREALGELGRVLAPGGVLLIEELQGSWVDFQDRFFGTDHPPDARFSWPLFREGLGEAGFTVLEERPIALEAAHAFLARKEAWSQARGS